MSMNIYSRRVAIVGVTGYAGQELDRLLASHPQIQVVGRFASKADEESGAEPFSLEKLGSHAPDVVVLATEHELSMRLTPALLQAGYRIVDMNGAFRLKKAGLYRAWYIFEQTSTEMIVEDVNF